MNPERSLCARHPVGFAVQIRYGRRRLHSARGLEPSIHGLYLELRAITLPEGTPVELEIDAPGRQWLVPAVVTCRDRRGIAVRFVDPQPALASDLAQADALPMPPPATDPLRVPLLERPGH